MDYETKPLTRNQIRVISKFVRKIFGCSSDNEEFPTLLALEKLPDVIPNSNYEIVNDTDLPFNIFACCYENNYGSYSILIKKTVYEGAAYNNSPAFKCFICHEICHLILFCLGFKPIISYSFNSKKKIAAYQSVEWQAKALCGEVTIPYEATIGMTQKEIIKKYSVTKASANYRVKLKN